MKLQNFKSQIVLCAKAELLNFRDIVYSVCVSETAELQVTEYSLYGGGTAGLKVKALVWKRNCETSKPQYFPCAESELRHFRAPSHTLICMQKRNFKSQHIPCAEAQLQAKEYSMCGSGTAELQVT